MNGRFALIGPGRVGSAIAKALVNKGYIPTAIIGRNLDASREACHFIGCDPKLATTALQGAGNADLILLAVADDQIAAVAAQLHKHNIPRSDSILMHFSGVQPAVVMHQPESQTFLYSLHPLLPFADRQQAFERLHLAPYVGEGDESARPVAEALCAALGGRFECIPTSMKQLYHTAACFASNYLVTLMAEATTLLQQCGIDLNRGEALLLPLLRATLDNVATRGTLHGLTGPIVRGDIGTISAHLQALQQHQPELLDIYCQLGRRTTLLAQDSGQLKTTSAQAIIHLLDTYPANVGGR